MMSPKKPGVYRCVCGGTNPGDTNYYRFLLWNGSRWLGRII